MGDMSKDNKVITKFKPCECGCGESIPALTVKGTPARYKHGHFWKKKENNPSKKGADNHNWKGGVIYDKSGYIMTYSPDHPNKNGLGYVRTHRLIYENYLSIMMDEEVYLPKEYGIHHINTDKQDNSLINLELITQDRHATLHSTGMKYAKKDMSNRICLLCDSKTTYVKKDYAYWYKYKNGVVCQKCYDKKVRKK